jgi:hypothetical protein
VSTSRSPSRSRSATIDVRGRTDCHGHGGLLGDDGCGGPNDAPSEVRQHRARRLDEVEIAVVVDVAQGRHAVDRRRRDRSRCREDAEAVANHACPSTTTSAAPSPFRSPAAAQKPVIDGLIHGDERAGVVAVQHALFDDGRRRGRDTRR